ncbi:MAG: hypothetical protein UD936_11710, partial [Acutalibacteraceae bacterium]|nr:hypothetical protein [Acutalibacteraceae bacterium]
MNNNFYSGSNQRRDENIQNRNYDVNNQPQQYNQYGGYNQNQPQQYNQYGDYNQSQSQQNNAYGFYGQNNNYQNNGYGNYNNQTGYNNQGVPDGYQSFNNSTDPPGAEQVYINER